MNKILVVEDDISIAEMIKLCLSKNNYLCETVYDGEEAAKLIETNRYDLVLLDIMLPGISGDELIDYINQFSVPVVFVTAKATVADKVYGLKLGAEDYIVKPFDLNELLARIETVLRRFNKQDRFISVGNITIDTSSRTVARNSVEVQLSMKEYDLFLYLVRNKNIALYRDKIYESVWREEFLGNTRTIDLHIQRLKKKLNLGDSIEAVYKIGYRFLPEKLI